jgi:hypothetical protein
VSEEVLKQLPLSIRYSLISPFQSDYVNLGGKSVAGLAYFPLAILGVVSFGLNLRQLRWGRLLLWIVFFVLSAYSARAIPLFAVIAGPITVLNFQEFAARAYGIVPRVEDRWKELLLSGRVVALLAALVLLGLTWPGALQAFADQAYQARRVGWQVEPDPGYVKAAQQLHEWHAAGKLTDSDRGFVLQPEMANYCAWYCPEERGFFDLRLPLFARLAEKYATLTRGLVPPLEQIDDASKEGPDKSSFDINIAPNVLDVLREMKVNHLVLSVGGSPRPMMLGLLRLWHKPDEWPMLYLNGRVTIFGWNDPKAAPAADRFRNLTLGLDRLAFGPDAQQAPAAGPPHEPEVRTWWTRYATPPRSRPLECDEVTLYVGYFQAVGQQKQRSAQLAAQAGVWTGHLGALVGNPSPGISHSLSLLSQQNAFASFLQGSPLDPASKPLLADLGPPGVEFLAVRAARRAVAESPDDGAAYSSLKDALQLRTMTRERFWPSALPLLADIRDLELLAAWQRAIKLQPGDWTLHEQLARFFIRKGYLDSALNHLKLALDGERSAAGGRGRNAEWEKQTQKDVESLDKEVQRRNDTFLKEKVNRPLLNRVELARQLGLRERALEELRELDQTKMPTDPTQQGQLIQQFAVKAQFLFDLGLLDEGNQYVELFTTVPAFQPHRLLVAAAEGRYDEVDKILASQHDEWAKLNPPAVLALYRSLYSRDPSGPVRAQELVPPALARLLLDQPFEGRPFGGLIVHFLQRYDQMAALDAATQHLQTLGEYVTLRAVMALERGENRQALQLFRQAETLLTPRSGALRVVQDSLELLQTGETTQAADGRR